MFLYNIDDILVTVDAHLRTLDEVLERIAAAGLRLNRAKCFFLKPSLEYLGYIIDKTGRHPTQEKVAAIREAPPPQNITELRSFLGMLTYYSKFLPNMSDNLARLLKKSRRWSWGTRE